jgi:hypothetical protein
MKSFSKLFAVVFLVAAIGFSMSGCELEEDNDYELLNGVWDRGDIVVTFNNDTAVFTQINSNSGWLPVLNSGHVRIGYRKLRDIKKSGDLKWSCQELAYDESTYVTVWYDCTITMHSGGQTLQTYTPDTSNPYSTYTKMSR